MLQRILAPLCLLALSITGVADDAVLIDPDRVFADAAGAYDAGDYDRAIELYEQLRTAGYHDKAITFNLGNAYFRSGDIGHSVLNYRRAWHIAPRDADILTNLKHVQNEAHLVSPAASFVDRVFHTLGPGEWAALLTLTIWVGAILFAGSLYVRRRRVPMRRASYVCGGLALLAVLGLWAWSGFNKPQEAVVIEANQQAKYGPLAAAKPHFDVPPGTIVRIRERSADWLRVSLNEKSGWIQESVCTIVSP